MLRCFYLVSGLNLKLSKSSLYGVGVSRSEITNLASFTGCSNGSFPFVYLGVPVGESMVRVKGANNYRSLQKKIGILES